MKYALSLLLALLLLSSAASAQLPPSLTAPPPPPHPPPPPPPPPGPQGPPRRGDRVDRPSRQRGFPGGGEQLRRDHADHGSSGEALRDLDVAPGADGTLRAADRRADPERGKLRHGPGDRRVPAQHGRLQDPSRRPGEDRGVLHRRF